MNHPTVGATPLVTPLSRDAAPQSSPATVTAPAAAEAAANSTFAEAFCARLAIPPEDYLPAVLRRALYPHARLLLPLIRLLSSEYLSPDVELVEAAAPLRTVQDLRDFSMDVKEFIHHPTNRRHGILRGLLHLRVSAQRLQVLIKATLPQAENLTANSASPWKRP